MLEVIFKYRKYCESNHNLLLERATIKKQYFLRAPIIALQVQDELMGGRQVISHTKLDLGRSDVFNLTASYV